MKLRHDLAWIEWDDAATLALGWQMDGEIKPTHQIARTIGFVVQRTREHLVIASTIDDEKANNHHFQIPRRMIRTMTIVAKRGSEFPQAYTP